ncbi:BspA family leucine-rich repeat surface protein [Flavobacterium sp. JAS]|uniref:BspA family leucine-rich repeat surface protein n=1 Tax=Flavobacterium sp. JAS TaxID=2897329 RepID=UPI001E5C6F5F|nr:BspA family leucine-rich repeat surface protein [Flavobacterium sp. JAS]MCD0470491.1 DUF285 domain-containing protein [Flavobacterium sp. JAS]
MNPSLFYEYGVRSIPPLPFISTWKTDNVSTGSSTASQVKLPLISTGAYAFNIDWGDGLSNYITSYNQVETLHTYTTSGTYTITITGICKGWSFANTGDRLKIISISFWGGLKLGTNEGNYFNGCANLNLSTVNDILDLTSTTSLASCFANCTTLTTVGKMNDWNTSLVTNMSSMFLNGTNFNQNIENWNVSKVVNFSSMFSSAIAFNQPLNNWNTSSATNMTFMFNAATTFNQSISSWNTSNVTNMTQMFTSAKNFNQNIGNWNVSKVISFINIFSQTLFDNGGSPDINNWVLNTSAAINMSGMFTGATKFNQPLNNWNTSFATNMSYMFYQATAFNQPLNNWDVSKVVNMGGMFRSTDVFQQSLNSWNTSSVKDMSYMFWAAPYNQPLNNWNTSAVTNMSFMFYSTTAFNQPINNWDTSAVTNMNSMFNGATNFNQNIGAWNVSKVTNLVGLFLGASAFNNGESPDINNWIINTSVPMSMNYMFAGTPFNQPLNNWNTSSVTDMSSMFELSTAFNQPLNNWDVSKVTNMYDLFFFASAFNQPLNNWNTSSVTNMSRMFLSATNFNQNIGNWNVSNVTNFSSFMQGKTSSTFSSANLDAIYNGWSSRVIKPSISIDFGSAKYTTASSTARAILTGTPNNWQITDGGITP